MLKCPTPTRNQQEEGEGEIKDYLKHIAPKRIVFLSELAPDQNTEPTMKFRLTYEGELRPTQRDPQGMQSNPLAVHKHSIRRHFHHQLKELWATIQFLKDYEVEPEDPASGKPVSDHTAYYGGDPSRKIPLVDAVAKNYEEFRYRFVPLVRESNSLLCSLDILFLRRDIPGSVISAGDIDNRIKSLIDALRRPRSANELIEGDRSPQAGEDPFFVLLEDDSQVTHLAVETDTLFDPKTDDNADHRRVRLVITVEVRPYHVTWGNISFV